MIRSFLDCAETAVAVALAYDWLHPQLSIKERLAIEDAIRRIVLEPALSAYEDRTLLWPRLRDNCALVSHCGILVAALAVLPCYRALSAALARRCVVAAWDVFSAMAPDGGWREGLSYWSLAMRYAGLTVAALESTLGDSFGLAERPGFAQTGDFALHAAGPSGAAFNFGDSEQRYDRSPLAWFAHRFGRPIDGWLAGDGEGWSLPFRAIWPRRSQASPMTLRLPTGKVFRSVDLACFRSTWSAAAPAARPVYLAIKRRQCCGAVRRSRAEARECLFARSGRRRHSRRRWGAASLGGRPRRRRLRPAGIFRARRGRPVRAPMALLSLARGRPQHPHDRRARPDPQRAGDNRRQLHRGRRQMGRAGSVGGLRPAEWLGAARRRLDRPADCDPGRGRSGTRR